MAVKTNQTSPRPQKWLKMTATHGVKKWKGIGVTFNILFGAMNLWILQPFQNRDDFWQCSLDKT